MAIELKISTEPVEYLYAVEQMENRVNGIISGKAPEMLWLLEHPSLYTAGTSAKDSDLLKSNSLPVYKTGRGGQYTYHGPGQLIAYVMLDLKKRFKQPDIKKYVYMLEEWIIRTLGHYAIRGERRTDRIGIWVVAQDGTEKKIAAIGIRVRKWAAYHGIAININPDLRHFSDIVPCGIKEHGVTSFHDLGVKTDMKEIRKILSQEFLEVFDRRKNG